MKVHRCAFIPPPKVMSAVVHVVPGGAPEGVRAATLERLTAPRSASGARCCAAPEGAAGALEALARLGIDSERRAETLSDRGVRRGGEGDGRLSSSRHPAKPGPQVAATALSSSGSRLSRMTSPRPDLGPLGGQHFGRRARSMTAASWVACGQGCRAKGPDPLEIRGPADRSALDKASPWPASAATSLGSSFKARNRI